VSIDLIFLAISLFTWGIGEGLFLYFQPLYLKELGADPLQIGLILGIAGAAMVLVYIPSGFISDKIGRRPLLRAAWSFGMIATWLMAGATSLPLFVVGMVLYNMTAFVTPPLNSYVTAARGKLSVGRALTLLSAMFNLGAVAGPLLGGWIGDTFGLRTSYFLSAILFVVSTALVYFLRSQPIDGHDPESPLPSLLSNRRYLFFLGISFVAMFAMFLPQPFTSIFLQDVHRLSFGQIGLLIAAGSLGNALLNLFFGYFKARLGFVLSQLSVMAFALLIWRGEALPVFALGYILLGGYRAGRTLASAQVRSLVHQAQMGLAYGLTESVNSLPFVLAPPLAGYLYSHNPETIYSISLAALAIALLLSMRFIPRETVISD